MKIIFTWYFLVAVTLVAYSQVPDRYYDSAENLSGADLKDALYEIIKGHKEFPYTSSNTDTWDILKEADKDPNNRNNVILFYTGWSVDASQEYNSGSGWNREHVWAKSRGDFGTSLGPGTDAHHLRPSDISVNSARNNRWFDNCTIPYLDGGLETGCFTSTSSWVWQPRDEVKGDVARMVFYMATRYEGENGEPDLHIIDSHPSDNYTKEPVHAKLSSLMAWHLEDPVDSFEQNRNEVVYSFQGNRNPFIDHPEYADKIWGTVSDNGTHNSLAKDFGVYPNPTLGLIDIETKQMEGSSLVVTSLDGQLVFSGQVEGDFQQIDFSNLKEGVYFITIRSEDFVSTRKIIKL